jgi:CheY-like chemotaxis protein
MVAELEKTILLVEDNPLDLHLTLRALKASGVTYPVEVCRDGVEALDYVHARNSFAQHAPVPSLVMLDLKLPKVNGIEVLRAMRADSRYRHVPVVILSTSDEEPDLRAAYENGANSYVAKVINFDQFTETVRQVSGYWLNVNTPAPR